MKVYGSYILLKPIKQKDTTASGLHLPGGSLDVKNLAEVVDSKIVNLPIGTQVIFSTGKVFDKDGQQYIVCKEEEILVVMD